MRVGQRVRSEPWRPTYLNWHWKIFFILSPDRLNYQLKKFMNARNLIKSFALRCDLFVNDSARGKRLILYPCSQQLLRPNERLCFSMLET